MVGWPHRILAVLALASMGCNSPAPAPVDAGPCNENPRACKAGTTCWVTDENGDYACLPSGAGGAGQVCQNEIGVAECTDGFDCLQFSTDMPGTCVKDCSLTDMALACPDGFECRPLFLMFEGGQTPHGIYVCTPNGPPADGGADSGSVDAGGEDAPPPPDGGDAGAG